MDRFLATVPRKILVTLLLVGGVALIVLMNPPHHLCDTQVETFKENVGDFLFLTSSSRVKEVRFPRLLDRCKETLSSGGCYELFLGLRNFLNQFQVVSPDCSSRVGRIRQVNAALTQSLDLLIRLGWGGEPPRTSAMRTGWLGAPELNLYCLLQHRYSRLYGELSWQSFRESYFTALPGASELGREEVWEKSILSIPCEDYR